MSNGGGGGGGLLQQVHVALSPADIMTTGFVEIAPAPGAGKMIVSINTVYNYVFGTAPYTVSEFGNSGLYYDTPAGVQADQSDEGVWVASASSIQTAGATSAPQSATGKFENVPVVWSGGGSASPYSGGDGTGSITYTYMVVTL
jgi:hypothetical protein